MQFVSVAAFVLMIASPSLADGKYFAKTVVVADPTIASQRAVISWRNGVQTLIVESAIAGDGDAFGWVLPLPAQPTRVEQTRPGALRTAAELIQPSIVDDRDGRGAVTGAAILLAIVSLLSALLLVTRSRKLMGWIIIALLFSGTLIGLLLPALAKARGEVAIDGVLVVQATRAGLYDVSVITGESADAVCDWLSSRKFRCDAQSMEAIAAYVNEGWCFVVAEVHRDAVSDFAPHPLKVQFPVEKPVYPMRLTAVGSNGITLDLFVIANGRASANGFDAWMCDRFSLQQGQDFSSEKFSYAIGERTRTQIGHPDLVECFWNGAILTHLRADMTAEQMRSDVDIAFSEYAPVHHRVYSKRGALGVATAVGLLVMSAAVLVVLISMLGHSITPRVAVLGLIGAIFISVVAAFGTRMMLDVRPVQSVGNALIWRSWAQRMFYDLARHHESMTVQNALDIARSTDAWTRHPGDPLGDHPNGIVIESDETGDRVVLYDWRAAPHVLTIGSPVSIGD